jgi:glycolate oxidase FAD binding subunit
VVKNVSGYDISRLYVGSLGTLGVIVETTLRLMPAPKAQETLVATYDDVQAAMKAAKTATSQSFTPQSVEVVTGEAIKVLPAGMATNGTRAAVVVSIAGWPGAAKRMANEMSKLLSSARSVERLSGDNAEAVWRALTDLGWVRGDGTVLLLRASLQLSSLDEAVSNVAAQQTEGLRMGMVVGPGYGGFRVLLWGTPTSPDRVRGFALAVRGAVSKLGGYAFVENCQVEVKNGLDVWGAVPGGLDVMKRVKKELDPNNILNPGRFVEGI